MARKDHIGLTKIFCFGFLILCFDFYILKAQAQCHFQLLDCKFSVNCLISEGNWHWLQQYGSLFTYQLCTVQYCDVWRQCQSIQSLPHWKSKRSGNI